MGSESIAQDLAEKVEIFTRGALLDYKKSIACRQVKVSGKKGHSRGGFMHSGDIKILLLEGIHPIAAQTLRSRGFQVDVETTAFSESELMKKVPEYHVLGIRSKTQITKQVINSSANLWAIGAFCIGTNQIDLEEANHRGVPVFNAPYSNTRSVAELIIAELVALSRHLGDRNNEVHQGVWLKSASGAREIRGKTLGIVGYGHIGSQIIILAEAIGLRVVYYDIVKKLPLGNSQSMNSLEDLLQQADFVTMHVPETEQTKRMISKAEFSRMKKGSFFLNASRGSVVVVEDLAEALKTGHLGGAAVDVYPDEPKNNNEVFYSVLRGLPNMILTPHIGGSTEEAQEAIGAEVAESFTRFLERGSTLGAVNFPAVDPGASHGQFVLMNVHRNVPGVLGAINSIVSKEGMNIRSQLLSTDSEIGYLVMRLEGANGSAVAAQVARLGTSIKTRYL